MLKRLGDKDWGDGLVGSIMQTFKHEFKRNGGDKISVLQPGSQGCRRKTAQIRNYQVVGVGGFQ